VNDVLAGFLVLMDAGNNSKVGTAVRVNSTSWIMMRKYEKIAREMVALVVEQAWMRKILWKNEKL
jgi:hypothetical protein